MYQIGYCNLHYYSPLLQHEEVRSVQCYYIWCKMPLSEEASAQLCKADSLRETARMVAKMVK